MLTRRKNPNIHSDIIAIKTAATTPTILPEEEELSDPLAPAAELEGVLDEEDEVATNELLIEPDWKAVVVGVVAEEVDDVMGVEERADDEEVTEATEVEDVTEEENTVEELDAVTEELFWGFVLVPIGIWEGFWMMNQSHTLTMTGERTGNASTNIMRTKVTMTPNIIRRSISPNTEGSVLQQAISN